MIVPEFYCCVQKIFLSICSLSPVQCEMLRFEGGYPPLPSKVGKVGITWLTYYFKGLMLF